MKPDSRKIVRDAPPQAVGMFAVFRHSSKLKRAHFCAMHDSYASASSEAVRLLTECVSNDSTVQHHFYVVEVAGRFSAGPEGLKADER